MENSLANKCKDLSQEWSVRNLPLTPAKVSYGSNKKVWWSGKCSHEWMATVKNRVVNGSGCPYCSHNRILEGFNDLASQLPALLVEWSDKNQELRPQEIMVFSNKKVWWKCVKGHEWEARVSDRANGSGCPYCTGQVIERGINDLGTCQPELSKEWSKRNMPLMPYLFSEKSRQNVWWECAACGHEWKAVIWSRVKGMACPVCADKKVKAGVNDLATTDPEALDEWDYEMNGELIPEAVSRKSMRSVWWRCRFGHHWKSKVCERVIEGKRCSVCESEYESVFPQLAIAFYGRKIGQEVIFNSDKEIGLELNAYLPEDGLAFVWRNRGSASWEIMEYLCKKRGIKLIRIASKKPTEIAKDIKKGFQSVHIFIASNAEEDEIRIRHQYEVWKEKNRS